MKKWFFFLSLIVVSSEGKRFSNSNNNFVKVLARDVLVEVPGSTLVMESKRNAVILKAILSLTMLI